MQSFVRYFHSFHCHFIGVGFHISNGHLTGKCIGKRPVHSCLPGFVEQTDNDGGTLDGIHLDEIIFIPQVCIPFKDAFLQRDVVEFCDARHFYYGVNGAAAAAVGRRLKLLSKTSQVICVTHLAQLAGFADQHFAVSKVEKKGRITTQIEELDDEQRAREIGRMLSGESITAEALKQAEQLIQAGQRV